MQSRHEDITSMKRKCTDVLDQEGIISLQFVVEFLGSLTWIQGNSHVLGLNWVQERFQLKVSLFLLNLDFDVKVATVISQLLVYLW